MKKISLLFLFLNIISIHVEAQTPAWSWAETAVGNNHEAGIDICTDASGNTYVGGVFTAASVQFGNITLYNTQMSGAQDIFVVKYDSSGNVLWAKSAGG
ncbi:MAG: hypothetical protein M3R17_05880 [Bacteroidota bacterium]|nr:hypothetical protein [Bacteroidota bacterium]